MTELPGTDDDDRDDLPADADEAAEIIRQDPTLGAQAGDAMTDDDARTPDRSPVGDNQGS